MIIQAELDEEIARIEAAMMPFDNSPRASDRAVVILLVSVMVAIAAWLGQRP